MLAELTDVLRDRLLDYRTTLQEDVKQLVKPMDATLRCLHIHCEAYSREPVQYEMVIWCVQECVDLSSWREGGTPRRVADSESVECDIGDMWPRTSVWAIYCSFKSCDHIQVDEHATWALRSAGR